LSGSNSRRARRAQCSLIVVLAVVSVGLTASSAARAEGGRNIEAATLVVAGQQYSGDMANAHYVENECRIYRSWYVMDVVAGQEVTLRWHLDQTHYGVSLAVFPPGTTDFEVAGPVEHRSNSLPTVELDGVGIELDNQFTVTAEASGRMPIELTSAVDRCGYQPYQPLNSTPYNFEVVATRQGPPSADEAFLRDWKAADEAVAGWDIKRARAKIEPLLAGNSNLNQVQRLWFDYSAERILTYVGRREEARQFLTDRRALSPPTKGSPDGRSATLYPYETRQRGGRGGGIDDRSCAGGTTTDPFGHVEGGGQYGDDATYLPQPLGFRLPGIGPRSFMLSYFARKTPATQRGRYVCQAFPVHLGGGATGVQSRTSKYIVVVPSAQPIVRKRAARRGASFSAQAFSAERRTAYLTWRRFEPRKTIRTTERIRNEGFRFRAPGEPGTWHLQIGVGSKRDFSTGVSAIKVR
jgi:hypothetical protein